MSLQITVMNTGVLVGGGGGPNKIKPWLIFNSIQAYPYSTCRQVEMSFLGMPQIAHFQVENEKAPYRGRGGHPPPPARSLRSLAKIAAPLAKIAPPQKKMFWLITPLMMIIINNQLFQMKTNNQSLHETIFKL